MLSCLKASELIEKKLNFKLSTMEKIQLFLHKSMCDACTAYKKQSLLIDKLIHQYFSSKSSLKEINTSLKEKIISIL